MVVAGGNRQRRPLQIRFGQRLGGEGFDQGGGAEGVGLLAVEVPQPLDRLRPTFA